MKVKLLRDARITHKAGEIVEVSPTEFQFLVSVGSATLGVTPSYLSTLFKKEIGMPLTEYVNNHRTEKAKQLLLSSNLQVQQIAQSCGILDVNYFTKIFKKYTGKTPNEYRKQK